MSAPKGNKFWMLRSSHGRNPIFESPDDLWDAVCEYFDWVEANPLYEDKGFAFQGKVTHEKFAKMRAMTITGLCIFLDITFKTWENYKEKEDFIYIITRAENIIKTQKFQGAAAELLNPNIIARDLGLTDKQNVDHTSGGDKINLNIIVDKSETAETLKKLRDGAKTD